MKKKERETDERNRQVKKKERNRRVREKERETDERNRQVKKKERNR